jgi:TROVE domain
LFLEEEAMAKLNQPGARTALPAPLIKTKAKDTVTFEGAPAFTRDAKSELFLLATTQFYGEDTFYEKGDVRADRLKMLVRTVAAEDPDWLLKFVPWLRDKANIRTAAIVAALEGAVVLAKADHIGTEVGPARALVAQTLLRPDEPAEALAYWLTTYGKKMPNPVRRGIADAATKSFNEYAFIKWDGDRNAVRMADVIELTHPTPRSGLQSLLFKYILDSRRRPTELPPELVMLRSRKVLGAMSDAEKLGLVNLTPEQFSQVLRDAGMTWEQVSSWGKFTAKTWEGLIPTMGYMALLRNLRNFQEAGISELSVHLVQRRLSDDGDVSRSRQLPYRFLAASLEATSPNWALALEAATQLSLRNLPAMPGRTLVLVDTSASMSANAISTKSKITPVMAGALFGVALALKGEQCDLFGFADGTFRHQLRKGSSVLRETERFVARVGEVGHGTQIADAIRRTFAGHDRVVIVTDMQTFATGDVNSAVPPTVPIYAFNMAGYKPTPMETGSFRHELGGLTDRTFAMIPMVEAGQQSKWPWEE